MKTKIAFCVALRASSSLLGIARKRSLLSLLSSVLLSAFCLSAYAQNDLKKKYNVKEYILDLSISNTSTEISGNVITNAIVTASVLDTFAVDLINTIVPDKTYMMVDSVFVNGDRNEFIHENELVLVPLQQPISQSNFFSVQIYYHGNAKQCTQTNWRGVEKYTYAGVSLSCSSSEPVGSKIWWPCKQDLTDKADSVTFFITTEAHNKSGSNGLLVSTENLQDGKVRYKWKSRYPVAYYLISFCVGNYTEHITYAELPNEQEPLLIQSLLTPNSPYYPIHLRAINKTKDLLYLFSELIGIYPFKNEKYGYCIAGHPLGAMENQTMSTMGYRAMDTTSNLYLGWLYIWYVAHELAHSWFGNYVALEKWNDVWIKEGMASYFEYIALQNLESQSRADYWMNYVHNSIKLMPGGTIYFPDSVPLNYSNLFDVRLTYNKAGAIGHLLRYEVNDDTLYFRTLRNFLSTYAHSHASTEDFKFIFETTTGKDFTDFFNQWVYGEGYPIFDLKWHQQNDVLFIESIQTTSTSTTPLFKTHFDLKLNYASGGDTIVRLYQGANTENFSICVSNIVESIQFDPDIWLINENTVSLGIDENIKNNTLLFSVYPNPTTGELRIRRERVDEWASGQVIEIDVFDVFGRKQKAESRRQKAEREVVIDISHLSQGIYILRITADGNIYTKKVIKY